MVIVVVCALLYFLLAPAISNVYNSIMGQVRTTQEFYATGDAFMTALNLSTGEGRVQQAARECSATYLEGRKRAVVLEMVKMGGSRLA